VRRGTKIAGDRRWLSAPAPPSSILSMGMETVERVTEKEKHTKSVNGCENIP